MEAIKAMLYPKYNGHMKKIDGINYFHDEEFHNETAANEILPYVFKRLAVTEAIDFGCGTGSWLSAAKKLGVKKVIGVDGIRVDQEIFKLNEDEFIHHDLKKPLNLNKKFDLAICLEVVEHLPDSAASNIIEMITNHADVVLFSAAVPNQTGDHHINEQWPMYWEKLFSTKGYKPYDVLRHVFWDNPKVDWWYKQNILIYAKVNLDTFGQASDKVLSIIHPEMIRMKQEEIEGYVAAIHSLSRKKGIKDYLRPFKRLFS